MFKSVTVLITLVLCASSTVASDRDDPVGMMYNEAIVNPGSNNMREMAKLLELIHLASIQRQNGELENDMDAGEVVPIPERLMAALQENGDFVKDKRGSYMSLCHFKICNMGRKRTWNPWIRT